MSLGRDPATMTAGERLAELAGILAVAFRRLQLRPKERLDDWPQDEALCDPPVDGDDADTGKEHVA